MLLALLLSVAPSRAETYPAQDIHLISAFPPGSGADVMVRYFAEKLRPLAGRTVLVDNKPGAGGNIAAEYAVRAKPDGYTIFVHAGNTVASNVHLIRNNPVDPLREIQIAATINRQAFMLAVEAHRPWQTVAELTEHLRARGDKASYGAAANSGVIMCALYKEAAHLAAVEVNYRMAQDELNDMASGTVDIGCNDPLFTLAQAREGRLRILQRSRFRNAPCRGARRADHDGARLSDGSCRLVCRRWFQLRRTRPVVDKDQRLVQCHSGDRGDTGLSAQRRRRSLDQHARRWPGAARQGHC